MSRATPGVLTYKRADGDERFRLVQDVITLGRSDTCTIVIPMPVISRLHARVELQHDRYVLFDEGSANGTFVNGKRLTESHHLSTGDELWLGSPEVVLHFTDPEETVVMQSSLVAPPLFIDENAHHVLVYGVPAQLSPLEFNLLYHFASNPGTVCTREGSFLAVWGQVYDHATCEDALNACIAKLRRNIRAAAETAGKEPPQITTVQRVGFRLDADVAFAQRRPRSNASAAEPASA